MFKGIFFSIRPVIAVGGTFLKGKYKGTIFIATCKDDNNQIYPLAFDVGDSKNDISWLWFFTKLRESIKEVEIWFLFLTVIQVLRNSSSIEGLVVLLNRLQEYINSASIVYRLGFKSISTSTFIFYKNEIYKVNEVVRKYLKEARFWQVGTFLLQ